ncbi:DNA/RNA-binding protein KIN17 [Rhizoctonia solani]|uniref:DNA/RNA-binding protein KIN17 n=1 Tax=Rhizoctonia solani TaxID=456999 RepID=A0A8H8SW35_9AGAM|nr:DNA/RNA-binding protein KIN17 [Rhizoctonia solani]QRW20124.1 DNA/RNA-binding protein KIN17 [Rhizoctonia solani]
MPRAEVGTPKYLANAMKSKGLQKLRWYCQVCQKQCRDENGFKCHTQSEAHLRQMLVVGENAGRHISDFSSQFQSEFVTLLSRRFGTKRVRANQVYQEFIQDKHHLHMNATRWVTLTEFVKHLGRTGVAIPKALAKADAARKKERATTSDEQRERNLIAEQIERAKETGAQDDEDTTEAVTQGLQRDEGEKLVLSFGAKKQSPPVEESKNEGEDTKVKVEDQEPAPAPVAPSSVKPINVFKPGNAFKAGANPLKAGNALKSGNVFKAAKPATGSSADASKKRPMSAAEALIFEEQERKRRRMEKNHAN